MHSENPQSSVIIVFSLTVYLFVYKFAFGLRVRCVIATFLVSNYFCLLKAHQEQNILWKMKMYTSYLSKIKSIAMKINI